MPQEPGLLTLQDEDAVRERSNVVVVRLPDPTRRQTISVELGVDLIGGRQFPRQILMCGDPAVAEMLIFKVAALGAGSVSGRQRSRLVKEEELGVESRPHDSAVPAAELESAHQPSPALTIAHDPLLRVMENSSIAEHQASLGNSDELARGGDAVLSRHCNLLAGISRICTSCVASRTRRSGENIH
jgi:hypothetical protein